MLMSEQTSFSPIECFLEIMDFYDNDSFKIEPCSSEPLNLPYGRPVAKEEIRLKGLPIKTIELLENNTDNYRIRLRDNGGSLRDYKVPKNFFPPDIYDPALADTFPEVVPA